MRQEAGYGTQARTIAAELARHFEQCQDVRRAVQYLQYASENAIQRSAHKEACKQLSKGLELVKTWPDTLERVQQELVLLVALGSQLRVLRGWADAEVERLYTRAWELTRQTEHFSQRPIC